MSNALITGANKGIGFATAKRLREAGHDVWIGSRDADRGNAAAAEIGARSVPLDVTDDASVHAAIETVRAADGHLDLLINNAGIGSWPGTENVTIEAAEREFDVNAVGVIRVVQAALPLLHAADDPVVVMLGTDLGSFWAVENPERPAFGTAFIGYGASKAAALMLSRLYANAEPDIRFLAIEPGYTSTDLNGKSGGQDPDDAARTILEIALDPDAVSGTFRDHSGPRGW